MATEFTYRLIVVVRATRVAAANAAAHTVDPAGGDVFTVPLQLVTEPTRTKSFYWCSWQMKPAEGPALRQALQNAGFKNNEIALIPPGSAVTMTGNDLWVFQATDPAVDWTSDQVLAAMGLQRTTGLI